MDFSHSPRAAELRDRVGTFLRAHGSPSEEAALERLMAATEWTVPPEMAEPKAKARAAGLWNLFLPAVSGLRNVEYELMGRPH
jgi:acyl-CoA dehydrogenase